MNSTSVASNSTVQACQTLQIAGELISNYVIRFIGALGIFVNLITLAILLIKKSKFQNNYYNFVWCRQFSNLIVCILGAGYLAQSCQVCLDYDLTFYEYFLSRIPLRIAFLASIVSDNLLVANRIYVISGIQNTLTRLTKKMNLSICLFIPLVLLMPFYFTLIIVSTDKGGFAIGLRNELNSLGYISIYALLLPLLEVFIPLVSLAILNVIFVVKYYNFMVRKAHLTRNRTSNKQAELTFTRASLILSTINILTRLFDLIVVILTRVVFPLLFNYHIMAYYLTAQSNLLMFLAHAFDALILFKMDTNLRKLVTNTIKGTRTV